MSHACLPKTLLSYHQASLSTPNCAQNSTSEFPKQCESKEFARDTRWRMILPGEMLDCDVSMHKAYSLIGKQYLCGLFFFNFSRELKRLMSVTLSPIYAHFSETLSGLTTIRALRHEVRFKLENEFRLETNQRANFCGKSILFVPLFGEIFSSRNFTFV